MKLISLTFFILLSCFHTVTHSVCKTAFNKHAKHEKPAHHYRERERNRDQNYNIFYSHTHKNGKDRQDNIFYSHIYKNVKGIHTLEFELNYFAKEGKTREEILRYLIYKKHLEPQGPPNPLFAYLINGKTEQAIDKIKNDPNSLYQGTLMGLTPFFLMVLIGNKQAVSTALEIYPSLANSETLMKERPLHFAIDKEIAEILINYNANLNAQDNKGNTALFNSRDPEIINLLLENGADISIKNRSGLTAIKYHIKLVQNSKIIDILNQFKETLQARRRRSRRVANTQPTPPRVTRKELAERKKQEKKQKKQERKQKKQAKLEQEKQEEAYKANEALKREREEAQALELKRKIELAQKEANERKEARQRQRRQYEREQREKKKEKLTQELNYLRALRRYTALNLAILKFRRAIKVTISRNKVIQDQIILNKENQTELLNQIDEKIEIVTQKLQKIERAEKKDNQST